MTSEKKTLRHLIKCLHTKEEKLLIELSNLADYDELSSHKKANL